LEFIEMLGYVDYYLFVYLFGTTGV
jgi:hypothetical protein